MEYIFLLFLAIPLDVLEIIFSLIDAGSFGIGLLLHIFQIILDFLFNFILIIFNLKHLFQKEVSFARLLIRRISPILVQSIGEAIPVLDFLPLRTVATIFLWLEVSGTLDKIIEKVSGLTSSVFETLPSPLREKVEFLARRHPVGSMLLNLKEKEERKERGPQIISPAQRKKDKTLKEKKVKKPSGLFGEVVSEAKMPRGVISLLFFFIFFPLITFAQTKDVYFFSKKLKDGVIVSAVFVDKKTKIVYSYSSPSRYEWKIPFSQTSEVFSSKPFVKIDLNKNYGGGDFKINLSIKDLIRGRLLSSFEGNIYLENPDVSIIYLKKKYFEIPFRGNYFEKEPITFKAFGFSSENFVSVWKLNGIFISNNKILDSSFLREGFLNLEVRNQENKNEGAFIDAFLK